TPRPQERGPAATHERDVLVPQVQSDDGIATVYTGAIGASERMRRTLALNAKQALRLIRVLVDALALAQPLIERPDRLLRPSQHPRACRAQLDRQLLPRPQ